MHVEIGRTIGADPDIYPDGVEEITVNGLPGIRIRSLTDTGVPRCIVTWWLEGPTNKARVRVVNDRFPTFDVCDLAINLAETIEPRIKN